MPVKRAKMCRVTKTLVDPCLLRTMMVDLLRLAPDDVREAVSGQHRRASCDSATKKTTTRLYHASKI